MISVAVLGLVLAGGMFAVRCYRVREYAQRRVQEIDAYLNDIHDSMTLYSKEQNQIIGLARELVETQELRSAFDHVRRHPWHSLPFGERIGLTPDEQATAAEAAVEP
jgi:hypothetical protein